MENERLDCAERGYLLIPELLDRVAAGDAEAARAIAAEAAAVGERFGDADLIALAGHEHGHALVRLGRVGDGVALLDETMVAVNAGELSPIVTGLVYCNVIAFCQQAYEVRRAREWTAALGRWCDRQPEMVAHTGQCLIHRAEIMQLQGAWLDALEEAQRAGDRLVEDANQIAAGHASYRQGEVHRLRGDLDAAEGSYREASRRGWEPQPGLALLRLAQGNADAAAAAIRRAVGEATARLELLHLLPGFIEVMLATGELEDAREGCRELERISGEPSDALAAIVADCRGAVELADGNPRAALVALREACGIWQQLETPYEVARARVSLGLACRALGDAGTAELELEAARGVFAELGAQPDLARVGSLLGGAAPADPHGLTPRELEVLRLVAAGETNRAIADELVLSERTIDRHLSNIFAKLGVSSRTAAAAFAFRHELV